MAAVIEKNNLTNEEVAGTAQGLTDQGAVAHPSDLYAYNGYVEDQGALPLGSEELERVKACYERDGVVSFSRGLEAQAPRLRAAVRALVDGTNASFRDELLAARERRQGAAPNYASGDKDPWIQYEAGTSVSEPFGKDAADRARKVMGFVAHSPEIRDLSAEFEPLTALVASLIGGDDLDMFQDMALLKPSLGGREKPWHQDAAYFNLGEHARVVGCWIALDEATPKNGCMIFQRGGHTRGELPHFNVSAQCPPIPRISSARRPASFPQVRDYQLCDTDAPKGGDVLACPLPPGGLVLFDSKIPHGTATNASPAPRNALQFHWALKSTAQVVPADAPAIGRIARFGGAARGGSC